MGANTTVFSALHHTLLSPPPFPQPEELVVPGVALAPPGQESRAWVWSYPYFLELEKLGAPFSRVAGWAPLSRNLGGIETPERVSLEVATPSYFPTLGVTPALGRGLPETDPGDPQAARYAVLSDGLWRRTFGADPTILGRTLRLDGHDLEIVGVMPPGFRGLSESAQLWVPLEFTPLLTFSSRLSPDRTLSFWMSAVARLAEGATAEQADRAMGPLVEALLETHPLPPWAADQVLAGRAVGLPEAWVDKDQARVLWTLQGAVLLVLLITCANLANLLLGRGLARRRELAVRRALGASRSRLLRLLLSESLVLAILGGALGVLVALWGLSALGGALPAELAPASGDLALELPVLVFNFAVATLSALLFGLAPAWRASREVRLKPEAVGRSGRSLAGTPLGSRPLLVAAEIALAMVLLVGAGLLLRSLENLVTEDVGFVPERLLTAQLSLPRSTYSGEAGPVFFQRLLESSRALPGVVSAGLGACLPGAGLCDRTYLKIEGRPDHPAAGDVALNMADPDFFRTVGLPILRGRAFAASDRGGAPRVAILNQAAAERWWPGGDPVGARVWAGVGWGPPDDWAEIVGVVPDARYGGAREAAVPRLYVPLTQFYYNDVVLALRVHGEGSDLIPSLRAAVAEIDPNLPLYDVATLEERLARSHATTTFGGRVLAVFAGLALVLAGLGVYVVMAFAVAARRREVGIRMALGATAPAVVRMLLGEASRILLLGTLAGVGGALLATRLLEAELFGVSARDPWTYLAVAVILGAIALAAAALPALAAGRIDPAVTVRETQAGA